MKKTFHAAVPTTTIIASKTNDPYSVAVFRSTGKHGNKLVLPGGRVKVGKQNWLQTGITEVDEELGIKNLTDIKFFCICSDPNRDVRQITIEKLLDGQPTPEGFPEDMDIIGHYTFDVVLKIVLLKEDGLAQVTDYIENYFLKISDSSYTKVAPTS